MSKPSFIGGKFTLQNKIGPEVSGVDDIPFFAAHRSLLLARYLVSNIKAVEYYLPEVVVGILPRDDEDHVALQFPTTSVGVFAVTANSIGGVGMRCDGIGTGRSVHAYDIDDNDPDIYFGFGSTDVQMYRGRLVKDSTIRKLWKSTCELSVELHAVHQQLLQRSGQA